jgi:hypothetical protein
MSLSLHSKNIYTAKLAENAKENKFSTNLHDPGDTREP